MIFSIIFMCIINDQVYVWYTIEFQAKNMNMLHLMFIMFCFVGYLNII